MRVGYIGIGQMGAPMARLLCEAGHEVTVTDVRRGAATNLLEIGARWGETARAVAEASEVVFTSLPSLEAIEAVVFDPQHGILGGLREGCAYIDTTSNSPFVAQRIAAACRERGIDVLDAPVSGRPPDMTVMVGGDAQTLAKYRHLLEAVGGRRIFHVGGTGMGCVAKAVTQYMGYATFAAAIEALLIAAKAGVDLRTLAEIVPVSAARGTNMGVFTTSVFKRDFEVHPTSWGSLEIIVKDMHLGQELARHYGVPSPIGQAVSDLMDRAAAQGLGSQAFPVAARVLEQMAGIELNVPSE